MSVVHHIALSHVIGHIVAIVIGHGLGSSAIIIAPSIVATVHVIVSHTTLDPLAVIASSLDATILIAVVAIGASVIHIVVFQLLRIAGICVIRHTVAGRFSKVQISVRRYLICVKHGANAAHIHTSWLLIARLESTHIIAVNGSIGHSLVAGSRYGHFTN